MFGNLGIALGAAADEFRRGQQIDLQQNADKRAQEMLLIQQQDAMHRQQEAQRRSDVHPLYMADLQAKQAEQQRLLDVRAREQQLINDYMPAARSIQSGNLDGLPDFMSARGQMNGLTQQIVPGANGMPGTVRWLNQDGSVAYEHPHTQEAYLQAFQRGFDMERAALRGESPFDAFNADRERAMKEAQALANLANTDSQIRSRDLSTAALAELRGARADAIGEGRGANGANGRAASGGAQLTDDDISYLENWQRLVSFATETRDPSTANIAQNKVKARLLELQQRGVNISPVIRALGGVGKPQTSAGQGGKAPANAEGQYNAQARMEFGRLVDEWLNDDTKKLAPDIEEVIAADPELVERAKTDLYLGRFDNPATAIKTHAKDAIRRRELRLVRNKAVVNFKTVTSGLAPEARDFATVIGEDIASGKQVDFDAAREYMEQVYEERHGSLPIGAKELSKQVKSAYIKVQKALDALEAANEKLNPPPLPEEERQTPPAQQMLKELLQAEQQIKQFEQEPPPQRRPVPSKAKSYMAQLEEEMQLPSGVLDVLWDMESSRGRHLRPLNGEGSAKGPFMLIDDTAKRFGVTDPDDFYDAARGAAAYFRWLLDYFNGDVGKAFAGYNAGEGNVGSNPKNINHARGGVDYSNKALRKWNQANRS